MVGEQVLLGVDFSKWEITSHDFVVVRAGLTVSRT